MSFNQKSEIVAYNRGFNAAMNHVPDSGSFRNCPYKTNEEAKWFAWNQGWSAACRFKLEQRQEEKTAK